MSKQIQLYYKNVLTETIGSDHGLSLDEIKALSGQIASITAKMAADRQAGKLPYRDLPYQTDNARKIADLAGQLRGRFDNLVVLGIGGSALGNIAVQTALNSPTYNLQSRSKRKGCPRLFVIDNVDPVQFDSVLKLFGRQLDRTLFNVVSKSGRTAETASQFLHVTDLLKERLGSDKYKENIVATTDANSGTLRSIVNKEGYTALVVPDGVGGRFSVLSDVGLFSAAMCGIDIHELLAGAAEMDERVQTDNLMRNPAAVYAVIQYLFCNKGKHLSVMFPYAYQLKDLSDWFRQLWAESLGKQFDASGEQEVFVGPTPIKALGTTDQHSQVQLYREGPNDKVFTFLEVGKYDKEVVIGNAGEVTELSYLSGRKMSDLIKAEKRGTEFALLKSHRPCLTVSFPKITPRTVGQFLYFFEVATSYTGELFGINTYDQPAVELGKEATFALMGHEKYQDLRQEIEAILQTDKKFLL